MPEQSLDSLLELDDIQESTLNNLRDAEFDSLDGLASATRNDLRGIDDINTSTAVNILRYLEREGYRERREVTEKQHQLQQLLRDLFQFDTSDLDFGIYRILNQRRDIIDDFIEEDLIRTVHDALEAVAAEERAELEEEVKQARADVVEQLNEDVFTQEGEIKEEFRDFGMAEDYVEAKERLEQYEVAEETEARVFNDLYTFFSRFYERGDFHAKRRFSSQDAKFMVPYNGEEVFFHWANRDQYYVKTSEQFTTYRFQADGLDAEFRVEDANVPQDNVKGDERYFILGNDPVAWDEDEAILTVTFQYRLITEDEADEFVNIYNEVTGEDRSSFNYKTNTILCTALHKQILDQLNARGPRETLQREDDGKTVLMQHLTRYTSKNTMDYFVHKDLGGFLQDELDYYIQNDILNTAELVEADADRDPHSLRRARVVRKIADRVITFLDQIESFQKRLFEKRKFVTQTDYMVTLDKVPDRLYDEIINNEKQLEQWHEVYNTDEWRTDLSWQGEFTGDVLTSNPYLMIDTALFDGDFKWELLDSFDNIEDETDGVLLHGENFQAVNLIREKFSNAVDCVYIDPPYNTGNDGFLYKDKYRHSSWLSMMEDRLRLTRDLMSDDALMFSHIDDNEESNLRKLKQNIFGKDNFLASICWNNSYSPQMDASGFSTTHDYILTFGRKQGAKPYQIPFEQDVSQFRYKDEETGRRYRRRSLRKEGSNSLRSDAPNSWFSLEAPDGTEVWPYKPDGTEGCWRWSKETYLERKERLIEWVDTDEYGWQPYVKQFRDLDASKPPETVWSHEEVGHNHEAAEEIGALLGRRAFKTAKPIRLLKRILQISTVGKARNIVLDYFAGSGTTGHAVINLNREDNGDRKYILVEMGEQFDTILRPRVQKATFSSDWSESVPQDNNGQSHMVKYHRIESYEDALNNVVLEEPENEHQQRLVEEQQDEYVSGYMLDFEAESPSLLEPVSFEHPFDYELEIEQSGNIRKSTTVDLVETFHYLLGADVSGFEAREHQDRQYVVTRCGVEMENSIDSVLTVWRDAEKLDLEQEREWFEEQFEFNEFDRIYINTESFVPGAEPAEVTFKERMEAGHDGAE
ncbi:site-specific DNA-methyltransferase [Halococcus thailandensis]|uniref:DNA methylase N-4/N-6 domain-containing protein n=1 Tax=Halococcus thailandensis JCM 13552 TaxID=1227457 RepID=M0NDW4_9EURY|nr:site-specific DNA-methyltransferase [Halococcus thailandensis]EMA54880.1 DNA methylase N-4/N-6 domain-containing protein [Halococcus thailandensis JCM 13552]